jgi:leader peptidase (prepilin peptidase)/N-methyltransferase
MTQRTSIVLVAGVAAVIAGVSFLVLALPLALISCLLGWAMLAIAVIDAQRFIIPDVLSLPAIPLGLLAAPMLDAQAAASTLILEHVGAAILGAAALYAIRQLYYVLRQREGLGLGDVKLAAVAGAWTGLAGLGHVLLLACVMAIATVLLLHLRQTRALRGSTAVAFGVFLAPSIWLVWCLSALGVDPLEAWLLAPLG